MSLGLIGRKIGMTRIFNDEGVSTPVTVLEVAANRVAQVKTVENDGYEALQVITGERKASRVTKAMAGHYRKANVEPGRGSWEFRVESGHEYEAGSEIPLSIFSEGQIVDVQGVTQGKGFAGGVKRHGFKMQDATHGNSVSHRAPGSIGQNQTPGRVFKGKKMAGHMGARTRTSVNLEVIRVDADKGLLLIKGSVPGAKNGDLVVRPATKAKG
ncbi:MAG: 50S ribosomal protein L3 [Gammaproteobacteria bacterium]|nr:50S ribosomal protein L3 [Gammaproteobacteria bacterium]